LVLVAVIFYALSQGETAYAIMQTTANYWPIKLMYWGFIFALYFHLCHGVRHLFWDIGEGFDPLKLHQYAVLELVLALSLTLATGIFI
jgi:succinate dehydrogenase / fumarate reductase cytochrome b subunit